MNPVAKAAASAAAAVAALGSIMVIYGFSQLPRTHWTPFMIVVVGLALIGIGMAALVAIVNAHDW